MNAEHRQRTDTSDVCTTLLSGVLRLGNFWVSEPRSDRLRVILLMSTGGLFSVDERLGISCSHVRKETDFNDTIRDVS